MPASAAAGVTGVLLAGGLARRMAGVDKGLQLLRGRPLVAWALQRLAPQVDEVLVNANRNVEAYAKLGYAVVPDLIRGHPGPLAGLHSGLAHASHPLVASVPCDAPFFPEELVARLAGALRDPDLDLAVARTGDRIQPVFCVTRTVLLPRLAAFIEDGGRKVEAWQATLKTVSVDFGDEAEFGNVNTPEELHRLETAPD